MTSVFITTNKTTPGVSKKIYLPLRNLLNCSDELILIIVILAVTLKFNSIIHFKELLQLLIFRFDLSEEYPVFFFGTTKVWLPYLSCH